MMKKLYEKLPADRQGAWAEKAAALLPKLEKELQSGDTVLVKASNGMKLYDIVNVLTNGK